MATISIKDILGSNLVGYVGSRGPAGGYTGSKGDQGDQGYIGSSGGISTGKAIAMSMIFGG